jgi:hypothetical protein
MSIAPGITTLAGAAGLAVLVTACSSSTSGHPHVAPADLSSASVTPTIVSSSTSGPPPAAVPDPCGLLSRAEAQTLAGVRLQRGDDTPANGPGDTASCIYDAPATGSSGSVQIFAQLGTPRALRIDKAIHHKFRTVPGIGDQTVEEPENSSIFVRKGEVWVYVSVPYGATPKLMESAAAKIADRLT